MIARLMGLTTVAPAELQRLLRDEQVHVFDVNAPGTRARGRVPGARPLDHASFGPGELPADRDATVVFYCSNPLCRKAPNAARRARSLGWSDVRVMSAGIAGWMRAGLPVESGAGASESPARS